MRVTGNKITCYAGETIRIEVDPVLQADGVTPYTDIAIAKLAAKKDSGGTILSDMDVISSKVVGVFTQAQTLAMLGEYKWEVRVKGSNMEVDVVASGSLIVTSGAITTAI